MEGLIIGVLGFVASIASVIALIIKSRGENSAAQTNAKTALDKRIDERVAEQLESAWSEIDGLKTDVETLKRNDNRKTSAITRILRAIAAQWPGDKGPVLDPNDIAEIEETIPLAWLRSHPPKT